MALLSKIGAMLGEVNTLPGPWSSGDYVNKDAIYCAVNNVRGLVIH